MPEAESNQPSRYQIAGVGRASRRPSAGRYGERRRRRTACRRSTRELPVVVAVVAEPRHGDAVATAVVADLGEQPRRRRPPRRRACRARRRRRPSEIPTRAPRRSPRRRRSRSRPPRGSRPRRSSTRCRRTSRSAAPRPRRAPGSGSQITSQRHPHSACACALMARSSRARVSSRSEHLRAAFIVVGRNSTCPSQNATAAPPGCGLPMSLPRPESHVDRRARLRGRTRCGRWSTRSSSAAATQHLGDGDGVRQAVVDLRRASPASSNTSTPSESSASNCVAPGSASCPAPSTP